MASVDRNTINGVDKTTGVLAAPPMRDPFDLEMVFTADAFPAFAMAAAVGSQHLDAAYGRALNAGRGVVGEGGDTGPGVVGIAGNIIVKPANAQDMPRELLGGPFPGRGVRAGVIGLGQGIDPSARREVKPGDAFGVVGMSDRNVGVLGRSDAHAGVVGMSRVTAVVGDAREGHVGVEGVGNTWGVYGHVNYSNPNADGVGVCGVAASNFDGTGTYVGIAGRFIGPVEVLGNLTVTGDSVVWGTKSAAARHDDGTHRLLYCVESAESQFEDFGEVKLVKGKAEVRLDRDFIGVADTRYYHVFLTPYGDSQGLFVTARRSTGFQVREQGGGKSSLTLSYRVVARRKHTATRRFAKVTAPAKPKLPVELAVPDIDLDPRRGKPRQGSRTKKRA